MSAGPDPLDEAYATCEHLARTHYENFPVASHLLPAPMRRHVAALYAFARVADDMADEGAEPPEARQLELQQWLQRLHAAVQSVVEEGGPTAIVSNEKHRRDDQILRAMGHSIRSLDLPITLFDDLISAFAQDTTTTRYTSWCDVLDYCRRSANPIGRLVLRIAGYRDAALDRSADAMCTALQLTNFWQDFGRDWRAGRLYVPAEVLNASGAREEDLDGNLLREPWASAIEACTAFTRQQFDLGRGVCDAVRGRLRLELRLTWLGGMRILERAQTRRFDLLHHRPSLGTTDVPWIVWQAMRWKPIRRTDRLRTRGQTQT